MTTTRTRSISLVLLKSIAIGFLLGALAGAIHLRFV